jgi:flavin reductase (DIM6/NTAB) family NADH-FMN oxidoreductase RutF
MMDTSDIVNSKEFRHVMGLFPTGVTVVAAQIGERIHAMTANAVMSVSLDPLLVCVGIGRRTKMNAFIEEAGSFSINILREGQRDLSQLFAGTWKHSPLPEVRFEPWVGGPRLAGCLGAIGCQIYEILQGGDHRLILGRVVALYIGEEPLRPLVFYRGEYRTLNSGVR